MIDATLAFLAGVAFTPWCFGILIVICLLWEHSEHYILSLFFQAGVVFVAYKIFNIEPKYLGYAACAYLPIGFGWSFWRWFRHCKTTLENAEQEKKDFDEYKEKNPHTTRSFYVDKYKGEINIKNRVDKVVCWILGWPISFLELVIGDIYDAIKMVVKDWCRGLYSMISKRFDAKLDALGE